MVRLIKQLLIRVLTEGVPQIDCRQPLSGQCLISLINTGILIRWERNVQMWAGRMAAGFGIFMCAVLSILASWADKGENYSAWIIFCTIYGSMELMMFLKLRNKWDLILAVIEIGGGILFFIAYLKELF